MNDSVGSAPAAPEAELPPYPGIGLGDIVLVDGDAIAAEAGAALSAAAVIGFDTESRPTFRKGEAPTGPHLVQLATEQRAYLFQVSHLNGSPVLREILEAPHILKVGFGLGNDHQLLRARLGIEIANVLDLGEILRGPWHRGTVGAKAAVARFFGQKLHKSKKVGTSNWAYPKLSERQLLYAANDAQVALRIYRAWRAQNPDHPV